VAENTVACSYWKVESVREELDNPAELKRLPDFFLLCAVKREEKIEKLMGKMLDMKELVCEGFEICM
jgi:hypothetical protein